MISQGGDQHALEGDGCHAGEDSICASSLEGPGEYERVVPTVWDQPKHGLGVVESLSGRKDSGGVAGMVPATPS